MVVPDIKIFDSSDTIEYNAYSWGVVSKGTSTDEVTLHIWNDKGGGAGSATAENVTVTTKTTSNDDTGLDLVEDKWFNVKCTSYGDTTFTAVGGVVTKAIGSQNGVQSIPSNEKAVVVNKIIVPSDGLGGLKEFLYRIDYNY